jgi:hypothetical protein
MLDFHGINSIASDEDRHQIIDSRFNVADLHLRVKSKHRKPSGCEATLIFIMVCSHLRLVPSAWLLQWPAKISIRLLCLSLVINLSIPSVFCTLQLLTLVLGSSILAIIEVDDGHAASPVGIFTHASEYVPRKRELSISVGQTARDFVVDVVVLLQVTSLLATSLRDFANASTIIDAACMSPPS